MSAAINHFNFERRLHVIDNGFRTQRTNEYTWGKTVVKIGSTYHAYIASWIDDDGISGYAYYSKIYHASDSNVLGPFNTMTELTPLQGVASNAGAAFNPYAVVSNGFVYLFYAATTAETPTYPLIGTPARDNNRIFLAKAPVNDPGNFTLIGSGPILNPGTGQLLVNNPAFYWDIDGNPKLVYKYATIADPTVLILRVATATNIEGPWTLADEDLPVTNIEDPCVWREGEFLYMICKAMDNTYVTEKNGILLYSKTGYSDDWSIVTDRTRAYRLTTVNDTNTSELRQFIERPFVYVEDGIAKAFFTVCLATSGLTSFNVGRLIKS
jgi:hypothetical protein